jgi:hypothetical protein
VAPESFQAFDQVSTGQIEIFINIFQACGSDGFHADERAPDVRLVHGVEEFRILRCFHGDLGEENCVRWKLRQPLHKGETLGAEGLKFDEASLVVLLLGEAKIGEGDGIKIVIGKSNKTKSYSAELNDLFHYNV